MTAYKVSVFIAGRVVKDSLIIKLAVVGLITDDDESPYRQEIQNLSAWMKVNNFILNVKKIYK